MTKEEAEEYAKEMTYSDAVSNALHGKCIPYRKATLIKLYELLDKLDQKSCDVPDINVGDMISRQAVLDAANKVIERDTSGNNDVVNAMIAWSAYIKSLPPVNPQPKTEQEPCEDCISRQKAIDAIDVLYLDGDSPASHLANAEGDTLIGKYQAITALDDLPSVTLHQKTGHWEWVQYDSNPDIGNWHCSECGCVVIECGDKKSKGYIPLYKYCPQCGCRIVEPQESEG